jgi:DNA-binding NtrC family response regulator
MLRILVHSPDSRLTSLLASALKPEYVVVPESGTEQLRKTLRERNHVDAVIFDFDSNYSPLDEQLALCSEIGDTPTPIIVMTDDLRRSTAVEFLRRGAFDCIRKPPSLIELKVTLERAHENALMRAELERMRQNMVAPRGCGKLVGSSGRAQVVYDLIRRVANLSASVLITGESGTGKELVAEAIHLSGSRAKHPFIAVSCGAIPETLIESEWFGHERGAFTGSTGTRVGYFEQAGEGTLLLDEIGELSLNTQVKLLRVLQQKEFCRLGSNRLMPLKARVLFATHRNLGEMTEAGTFRKDLFYRVNVMNLHVPPLRDRTEDIPLLARHFLSRYSEEYGKVVDDIRPNAMELLVEYEWPGNIRELENVIQGAVIRADDSAISRADLPEHLQGLTVLGPENINTENFENLIRQYKIDLVQRTVEECQGNKTLAAQKLGLSRAYLHRLLRQGSVPETIAYSVSA